MSGWERLVYVVSLAFWRAYFDVQAARLIAEEEAPNDADRARRARFRDAVRELRAQTSDPRPADPSPAGKG